MQEKPLATKKNYEKTMEDLYREEKEYQQSILEQFIALERKNLKASCIYIGSYVRDVFLRTRELYCFGCNEDQPDTIMGLPFYIVNNSAYHIAVMPEIN